jgi:hypothetical protein
LEATTTPIIYFTLLLPLNSPTRIRARAPSARDGKMPRPPVGTRGNNGGKAAGRGAGSGEGSTREASSKTSGKKFTGVSLDKRTGRWRAECKIDGKRTSLGSFDSEEEAARAWDRIQLWACKAHGKKEEDVKNLNFPFSDYSDDEVTALQGLTQEEVIKKLRRTEERVANQSSAYAGVTLKKSTGRWKAECQIGGKKTYLGIFGGEEEAARAWDRIRLWLCKSGGK